MASRRLSVRNRRSSTRFTEKMVVCGDIKKGSSIDDYECRRLEAHKPIDSARGGGGC